MAKKKKQLKAQAEVEVAREEEVRTPSNGQAQAGITDERQAQPEITVEPPLKPVADARVHTAFIKEQDLSQVWRIGSLVVMAVAVLLRIVWLTLKPFHHDEGVNGFFLTGLFRDGVYKYDPSNYHGPDLYYFALLSSYFFGLSDFAVRLVTVVFGVLTVALVFSLRRYLGTLGTLFAASLVALSPGLTYFSRYFIHEILLVFFTFAVVVCVLKFIEGERPGQLAIAAMAILLLVCALPIALQAPISFTGENKIALQVARFGFIALGMAVVYFAMRRLLEWDEGRPMYLLLASGSAMMTFATKETSFISFGTMLIALGCVWGWLRISADNENGVKNRRRGLMVVFAGVLILAIYFNKDVWSGSSWFYDVFIVNTSGKEQPWVLVAIIALLIASLEVWRRYFIASWRNGPGESTFDEPQNLGYGTFAARLNDSNSSLGLIFLCLLLFTYVGIVFFSSFFTYEKGIGAAFEAYNIWTQTGTKDHAQSGAWGYLKWLLASEAPLLILGALGALIAFWKAKHRFAMFVALWAFGLFAAYTLIPYKTPWIAINFVLPMGLIAGYGIGELATGDRQWQRTAAKILAALALAICAYQTIELNFFRYDDEQRPYVYVHSLRSMSEMEREIGRISERAGTDRQATIVVTSPDQWPLPWTLLEYKKVGFHGSMVQVPTAEIVIGSTKQATELQEKYAATHQLTGNYTLRPGVDLLFYVRKDLASKQ
jgi:uncharacterized protein (TIGR03663 family)